MSDFTDVDASGRASALASYLDVTDHGLSAMKAYMTAAAARVAPGGLLLDVGCGVGHDLARMSAAGLRPVGIDVSSELLGRAAAFPVVRADAATLPFAAGSFDGCRTERVLQHVRDPGAVVAEMVRVVRSGGFVAAFEPDHTTLRAESVIAADLPGRLVRVRQPGIGGELAALCRGVGLVIDDVVTEQSYGSSLAAVSLPVMANVRNAGLRGDLDGGIAEAWIAEQEDRLTNGAFRASWTKILVIAHKA